MREGGISRSNLSILHLTAQSQGMAQKKSMSAHAANVAFGEKRKHLNWERPKLKEEESMPEATIRSKELWRIGGAVKKAYVILSTHHQ